MRRVHTLIPEYPPLVAFLEGYADCSEGVPSEPNPHQPGTLAASCWQSGWMSAEVDRRTGSLLDVHTHHCDADN
jgi:hypothetical protein